MAVSGDMVAVGAATAVGPFGRSGHVFAYEEPAPGWSGTLQPSGDLISSDGAEGEELGYSVAVSGDTDRRRGSFAENSFLTGAGEGLRLGEAGQRLDPEAQWPNRRDSPLRSRERRELRFRGFESSETTAVVTNPYFNSSDPTLHEKGYLFVQPAAGWSGTLNEDAQLLGADVTNSFFFGQSVSISGDTVVVGAPFADTYFTASEGAAYVFDKPSTGWSGPVYAFAKKSTGAAVPRRTHSGTPSRSPARRCSRERRARRSEEIRRKAPFTFSSPASRRSPRFRSPRGA